MSVSTQVAPVPFVDLNAQYATIRGELDAAVAEVAEASAFIGGPAHDRFERHFARWCGVEHAVGTSSGTSALHLALAAAGVGAGDEVIVPTMTFIATAAAVRHAGATCVFADSDSDTCCLGAASAEEHLTPRTKAIVPVDLYGRLADYTALESLATRRGVALVEDAAQSHGATPGTPAQGARESSGRRAGGFGRVAAFSFYPGKNLGAWGDAGAITTNDAALAERARRLANHGRLTKYEHSILGYNHRLDALQAAILDVKLHHIDAWNAARRAHAETYGTLLAGVGDLMLPATDAGAGHVWHLYVVRTRRRDALMAHLAGEGIATGIHYPLPVHLQPAFADHPQARKGTFPVAEAIAAEALSLPMFAELTDGQQERTAEAIRGFFERPRRP